MDWQSTDYDYFAQLSYNIAIQVYDGLTEDEAVPDDYINQWKPVAYKQLVLGGHRLYYAIDYIFSDSAANSEWQRPTSFLQ